MLFPTQFLSNIQAHTFCDICHIWNQEWLNTYLFKSVSPSSPFYPLASPLLPVSVCLSTHALRDEREEPLAYACDHHHHCDWCHSDCCPGDGGGFAEQTCSPKVQGKVLKCCDLFPVWESNVLHRNLKPKSTNQIRHLVSI